jgi:PIN domain nuclease of toxin-antitoxin system
LVPHERERHGILSLPLNEEAALHLTRLHDAHQDPFDRMLVCQALTEGMVILTPDPLIKRYPVRVEW